MSAALIKEVDQQASTGGRRAISLSLQKPRNFNAIGVRLGRYDATLTL
ncbi:hypothetical protein LN650_23050 [Klebsiella pneumoniae subsp. pneumoniae]|nr:hypothetical protein [Klebsiella pneumoniae subsp. pneumoniae]